MNGNDVQSSVITEKYKVGKVIGDGNFAVVRECMERYYVTYTHTHTIEN